MKVNEVCAKCLYDQQRRLTDDKDYLDEVQRIIDAREEKNSAPYLLSLFEDVFEERFGKRASFAEVKKSYNDLVLSMEDAIRERIESTESPLETALLFGRIGNYIDFGAQADVDTEKFLSLFDDAVAGERDREAIDSFIRSCSEAKSFLLVTDNSGEIVLDKLLLEQIKKSFPDLKLTVLVRGGEVINDATVEDAEYVGIGDLARIVSNGKAIAGTEYDLLSDEARQVLDSADVILAKGQGNYETLSAPGKHVFYSFLCKCDLFSEMFKVPKLTGMFVETR